MYTSSKIHKNVASFTAVGYTSIGDPYQPKTKGADARFKGKQFNGGRTKKPTFGEFSSLNQVKTKDGSYATDAYDKKKSAKQAFKPNDKGTAGFGSKDARSTIADTRDSERYRETLKQEARVVTTQPEGGDEDLNGDGVVDELDREIALSLYDRVTAADDESLKVGPKKGQPLHKGSMMTSSDQYGANVADAGGGGKVHARVAVCKQFFNTGKISVGNQPAPYLNM